MIVPAMITSGIVKPGADPAVRIRSLSFRVNIPFISHFKLSWHDHVWIDHRRGRHRYYSGAPNVGTVADPRKRFTVPVGVTSKKFAVASVGLEQSVLQT
jgi:hypothetical protein